MRAALRIFGMVCLFAACILTGIEMERGLKHRWLFLRDVCETLQVLEKEMSWQRAVLPEILKNAARICKTEFGSILLDCARTTEERGGIRFHEIWTGSVWKWLPADLLNDMQAEELLHLDSAFCNADTVLQKTHLQTQQQRFLELCENAHDEWKEKGALYRKLSTAAGVTAVILLW